MSDDRIAEDLKRAEVMIEAAMKPDSEWRNLGPEEVIQEGDEWTSKGHDNWMVTPDSFCRNPVRAHSADDFFKFRRRVSTPATDKESLTIDPLAWLTGLPDRIQPILKERDDWKQRAEKHEDALARNNKTVEHLLQRAEKAEALQSEASAALTWANEVLADYRAKLQKAEARLKEDPNGWNIVDQMEAVNKNLQEKLQKAEEGFKFYLGAWEQVEKDLAATREKLQQAEKERDEARAKIEGIRQLIARWQGCCTTERLLDEVDECISTWHKRACEAEKEREMAELCLREIYMALGNSDPADGEGVSREDVVRAVEETKKERDEAMLSLRLSLAEMALRETVRDQLRAENDRLNAEIELHRKGEFDDSWQRQCEENERLESENESLREALDLISRFRTDNIEASDGRKRLDKVITIAQQALAKGGTK